MCSPGSPHRVFGPLHTDRTRGVLDDHGADDHTAGTPAEVSPGTASPREPSPTTSCGPLDGEILALSRCPRPAVAGVVTPCPTSPPRPPLRPPEKVASAILDRLLSSID